MLINHPTAWPLPREALMANLGMSACNEMKLINERLISEIVLFVSSCLYLGFFPEQKLQGCALGVAGEIPCVLEPLEVT